MNINFIKKNWMFIVAGIVAVAFLLMISLKDEEQTESIPVLPTVAADQAEDEPKEDNSIMVDVKGEVSNPGVYKVDNDARVNDVILLAGGFTENADALPVNLAQRIQDEMTIIVPKIGDANITSEYENSTSMSDGKVKINYATQAEIESLSGIGPSKAQIIIQYREENGLFKEVEDLLNISGIGEKTLENIRDELQVP